MTAEPSTTAVRPDDVRAVLATIPDPEMPPVSLVDLGMVEDVHVDGAAAQVDLVPTFTGCPALELIADDVVRGVRAALPSLVDVRVRWRRDVLWTSARITAEGRDKLRAWGIAPPGSGQAVVPVGRLGARPTWARGRDAGAPVVDGSRRAGAGVTCPLCGSDETVQDSPFGAALCRSSHFCQACRNPFDAVKP